MYRLTYGSLVIFDPSSDTARCESLQCSTEANTSGALSFEITPDNPAYGRIEPMSTNREIVLSDDGDELFRGRVTESETSIETRTKFTCIGALGYLADSVVEPYGTYVDVPDEGEEPAWTTIAPNTAREYAEWLIERHNAQCGLARGFRVATDELPQTSITRSSTEWPTTLQELTDKVLTPLGCYARIRHVDGQNVIDFLADGGADAEQSVELTTNMLDMTSTESASSPVTCVIPTGKDADGKEFALTSSNYLDGPCGYGCTKLVDRVINSAGDMRYGRLISKHAFDDAATPSALVEAACAWLETAHDVVDSVTVSAVDMHHSDKTIKPIHLLDWVLVVSKPHGIRQRMMCSSIAVDCLDPSQTKYTFGAILQTMTRAARAATAKSRIEHEQMITDVSSISSDAKAAAKEATAASTTAASKRRVFVAEPTPPYDIGDLWVDASTSTTRVCMTAKKE